MSSTYTFFMHLNATPAWLSLSRSARKEIFTDLLGDLLRRYPQVRLRLYDTEAFSARCSDIAVFETADLRQYCFLIDALRDSVFYSQPYFEVLDIIPAVEEGFVAYEASLGRAEGE